MSALVRSAPSWRTAAVADINDFSAASTETDACLRALEMYCSQIEDGERTGDDGLVLGLVGRAVVAAIRESATRADYVARDLHRMSRP